MKEKDIRPKELFQEYLRLSAEDVARIFDMARAEPRHCPSCGGADHEPAFEKNGFQFCRCRDCGSLFVNPVPPPDQFDAYYRDGRASAYWAEVFMPAVIEQRRAAIVAPRARRIAELCAAAACSPRDVLDVGAGHGIFLQEWRRAQPDAMLLAVEPNAAAADFCRANGIEVFEGPLDQVTPDWHESADLVTCFEVIEHVPDVHAFVRAIWRLVRPGGAAVVTTLVVDGFDIQLLWERSKSVSPPHHINFASIDGAVRLFQRAGFTQIEVLTPGELDTDIVLNALADGIIGPEELSRFESLLLSRGETVLRNFQKFLAENQLSSHCWIMARK